MYIVYVFESLIAKQMVAILGHQRDVIYAQFIFWKLLCKLKYFAVNYSAILILQ
jgi:hypothetical protein